MAARARHSTDARTERLVLLGMLVNITVIAVMLFTMMVAAPAPFSSDRPLRTPHTERPAFDRHAPDFFAPTV